MLSFHSILSGQRRSQPSITGLFVSVATVVAVLVCMLVLDEKLYDKWSLAFL